MALVEVPMQVGTRLRQALQAAWHYQRSAPTLSGAQLAELLAQPWPGNVRERHNVADRFVLGLLGDRLDLAAQDQAQSSKLPEQIEQFERVMISEALKRQHGDVALAAKALGLPKQTLYDKLRRLRIGIDSFKPEG